MDPAHLSAEDMCDGLDAGPLIKYDQLSAFPAQLSVELSARHGS
jgi:hypothetical protein